MNAFSVGKKFPQEMSKQRMMEYFGSVAVAAISGAISCAVELRYLKFLKCMIGYALLVVTTGYKALFKAFQGTQFNTAKLCELKF